MENLLFDGDHCKKSVLQAIQPELEVIAAIEQKKQAISEKLIENEKARQALQKNHDQLSNLDDFLGESLEDHELRLEKIAKLNNRIAVLTSFESNLKKEDSKCDDKLSRAKEALYRSFSTAAESYVMKARKGVIDAFEGIVNADTACFSLLHGLYMQVAKENGIYTSHEPFLPSSMMLNICPLTVKKAAMERAINNYRADEIKN